MAEMAAREGMDYNHYCSAEEGGGSSMSVPPESKGRGRAKDRRGGSRDKRWGGRGWQGKRN
eukprot:1868835-Karenia_brevis.AAC.1